MIYYEDEYGFNGEFEPLKTAEKVISYILSKENFPYTFDVSLTLTTNEAIKEINREYRNIDKETDVLSFPNAEFETPADYSFLEDDDFAKDMYFDLDTEAFQLGDIIISVPKMLSQAEEYGHAVKREFAFLVAHSTLHLIGYDHMEENEAKIMEDKQKQYLDELGISR